MRSLTICLVLSCIVACGQGRSAPTSASTNPPIDPGTFRATGTVVEIGAGPVADATVSVVSCNPSPSYGNVFGQALTDATGGFRLTVASGSQFPVGCVFLRVKKEGYVQTDTNSMGSADGITIKLQRLRQASGTVVEVDGGPVPGVKVVSSGGNGPATFADANGSFVQHGVGAFLTLEKSGYVSRTVQVPEGQDLALGTVYIQRAIVVSRGTSIARRISSADVDYDLADMWDEAELCSPCKWIDLETGQQDLDIEVQWSGEIPLQLWAATDYYGRSQTAAATPGESALTLRVPAATRILLVGVRRRTGVPQTLLQPEAFELNTIVR